MRKLRYTVRNVGNYERKNKKSLVELIQEASVELSGLVELVALGLVEKEIKASDMEEAEEVIQEMLDSGNTVYEVVDKVYEEVASAGFLTEVLKDLKLVEELEKGLQEEKAE